MSFARAAGFFFGCCFISILSHPAAALNCNKISSCLMAHSGTISGLMSQANNMRDDQNSNPNATVDRMRTICRAFQPILRCTGVEEARRCELKMPRGQVFRLNYLAIMCSVTIQLHECQQVQGDSMKDRFTTRAPRLCPGETRPPTTSTTTAASNGQTNELQRSQAICSAQFPDIEDTAREMGNKTNQLTTPQPFPSDCDPYEDESCLDSIEQAQGYEITAVTNCTRLELYTGCWMHFSQGMCNNESESIIEQMYNIYNDLSGRKCHSDPRLINYGRMKRLYVLHYLTDPPCPTTTAGATTRTKQTRPVVTVSMPSNEIESRTRPPKRTAPPRDERPSTALPPFLSDDRATNEGPRRQPRTRPNERRRQRPDNGGINNNGMPWLTIVTCLVAFFAKVCQNL